MAKQKLCEIFDMHMGKTPARNNPEYWDDGTHPWISIADMTVNGKYIKTTKECITDRAIYETGIKAIPYNTVIMSFKLSVGKVGIVRTDSDYAFSNEAIMAFEIPDVPVGQEMISNDYAYYLLQSLNLSDIGNKAVMGKTLNRGILDNIEVEVHSWNEQLKIVAVLTKVDELIEQHTQQLTKLDQLVKSRFVEMFYEKDFPIHKWNDVFNTTTGKLDSNAMVADGEYPFFTCAKEVFRIDKYAFDQEALLLAGNNAAGKYDVKYYKGKFNAYQRTYVLSLKQDWSYQLFRYQLEDKLTYLQQQSLGGLTKYLTLKILSELEFIVPPMDKQSEFATFVEQTDKLKLEVKKSLEKLETLKKSLMQQYFG